MDPGIISNLIDLGGNVVIAAMFLWYLEKRDARMGDAFEALRNAILEVIRELEELKNKMTNK